MDRHHTLPYSQSPGLILLCLVQQWIYRIPGQQQMYLVRRMLPQPVMSSLQRNALKNNLILNWYSNCGDNLRKLNDVDQTVASALLRYRNIFIWTILEYTKIFWYISHYFHDLIKRGNEWKETKRGAEIMKRAQSLSSKLDNDLSFSEDIWNLLLSVDNDHDNELEIIQIHM